MNVYVAERIDPPGWTGLPLGRLRPPGHGHPLPVAVAHDSIFVWNEGASAAKVRMHGEWLRCQRQRDMLDIMAANDEALVQHDRPESPGECLVVEIPSELRRRWFEAGAPRSHALGSRFCVVDSHVAELVRGLEAQCEMSEPWGKLYTQSISIALVSYLFGRYGEAKDFAWLGECPAAARGRLTTAQRSRIVRFVEARLGEDIGLDKLAGLVGYSAPHFARLFKQAFRVTPHRFVVERRLDRARQLLRRDEHSIREIAALCGFAGESHFSTTFRRHAGISPSRFRIAAADRW